MQHHIQESKGAVYRCTETTKRQPKLTELLPHQERLDRLAASARMPFPYYICWSMGSGKTIGACAVAHRVLEQQQQARLGATPPRALVLCNLILVPQWQRAIEEFAEYRKAFDSNALDVRHWNWLDTEELEDANLASQYALVVVDEAHQFNNVIVDSRCHRLRARLATIQTCPRIVYMSGTPILEARSTLERTLAPFRFLMSHGGVATMEQLSGSVSFYDMRADDDRRVAANTPRMGTPRVIRVCMSWPQLLAYFLRMRSAFALTLPTYDDPRCVSTPTSTRFSVQRYSSNRYNSSLRSCCFNPFPKRPETSPKMRCIIDELAAVASNKAPTKQLVYSFYKHVGVNELARMWARVHGRGQRMFVLSGDVPNSARDKAIVQFNACEESCVMFATWVAGFGLHFENVTHVHLADPSPNAPSRQQMIDRTIRFMSHTRGSEAVVEVHEYVTCFPDPQSLDAEAEAAALRADRAMYRTWKDVLHECGVCRSSRELDSHVAAPRDRTNDADHSMTLHEAHESPMYVRSEDVIRALAASLAEEEAGNAMTVEEQFTNKHNTQMHDNVTSHLRSLSSNVVAAATTTNNTTTNYTTTTSTSMDLCTD